MTDHRDIVERTLESVVMYCDENRLTATQGDLLADRLVEELTAAVENRRDYLEED